MYDDCPKCGSNGFCKCRQLSGMRSGMGQKKVEKELTIKDPKHNKARSQTQERNLAKDYKDVGFERSRRVPMSGAISGLKGDVDPGERYLVEAKQTRSGKIVIEPIWIKKIKEEAEAIHRDWILHAHVASGEDKYTKVVVLDEDVFLNMVKQIKAYEQEFSK